MTDQHLPCISLQIAPQISHLDEAVIHDTSMPMRTRMETYVKLLQNRIVTALSQEETGDAGFRIDQWQRKEGGEGISCVLQDGQTFEKAGVNISIVHGKLPLRAIQQMSADHAGLLEKIGDELDTSGKAGGGMPFYATGLSLVVHPRNPYAPTVHFNYRYFELTHPPTLPDGSPNPRYDPKNPLKPVAWWFGGGTDLTPVYLFTSDARHFHSVLKETCDIHDPQFYPTWKKWCDTYFWIPHRSESRGVGGIFFDDLSISGGGGDDSGSDKLTVTDAIRGGGAKDGERVALRDGSKMGTAITSTLPQTRETLFATVRALGDAFLPAYLPILQSRKNMPYGEREQAWQRIRRGRYVEFNLVYDRGTKFGLQTPGARMESILMSLPLLASWEYGHPYSATNMASPPEEQDDEEGRRERETMNVLRKPKDWV